MDIVPWLENVHAASLPPDRGAQNNIVAADHIPGISGQSDDILFQVERPAVGMSFSKGETLTGFGWLLSNRDVSSIAVFLDDFLLCYATLKIARSDIAASHPEYENHEDAGFWFTADVPKSASAGPATLTFQIRLGDELLHRTVAVQITEHEVAQPVLASRTRRVTDAFRLELEEVTFDGSLLRVSGWSFSKADIETIHISLNETLLGQASYGIRRTDVAAALPHLKGALQSGFTFEYPVAAAATESAVVCVQVLDKDGSVREARRRLEKINSLVLFCDEIELLQDGRIAGAGWAVCATGVTELRVAVDGRDAGVARPDVGKRFPKAKNAQNAGFKIDCRLDGEWSGDHVLKLTATGGAGEERIIEQWVAVSCPQSKVVADGLTGLDDSQDLKFYLDLPQIEGGRACDVARGFLLITGWAFARAGMDRIEVFIDGEFHACAFTGIRREDIQAAFPGRDALLSGFAILIPPQALRPGQHAIRLSFLDKAANIGEVDFSIDAETAPEGPGPWQLGKKLKHAEVELGNRILAERGQRPFWTLIMPLSTVGTEELAGLRLTVESLERQAYGVWRLVVCLPLAVDSPDGSAPAAPLFAPDGAISQAFRGIEHLLPKVSFLQLDRNRLLSDFIGTGGLLSVLCPGDQLGEDALLEMSIEASISRDGEFFYSDERRIDPSDGVEKAFFKPDWSPDLLLSTNYIGRFWSASYELLKRSELTFGGLLDGNEYAAVLRLTELANGVVHLPKVLCARGPEAPAHNNGRDALVRAIERRGIAGDISPGCLPGTWLASFDVAGLEARRAKVSIIIPTVASRGLVKVAIDSIRTLTRWKYFEIILLDNIRNTSDQSLLSWKQWMRENADSVIEIDEDFNWSRFNNIGAAKASGEFLLFLNDDIEITDADWLHKLLAQAQRSDIGVVGPQLLYPDGRVQHAGVFLANRVGRHAFRFYPKDAPGAFGLALTQRNVISVTGACMLMRRAVYKQVDGFDELHPVVNNDLDFCLRVQRAGLRVLYTPQVSLVHHEMVSRSKLRDDFNSEHFDRAWRNRFLKGDPYFHPRLSREYEDYQSDSEPVRQFQAGHPLIPSSDVKRILAVKVDHIGDFISSMPAFRRIKKSFPNAKLYVLAARASLALAELEPAIDEVIEFNFFHARSENGALDLDEETLLGLQRKLSPLRFDIAMDLRRQPDTRIILKYTGARWLAGFDERFRNGWLDIAMEFEGDIERSAKRSHVTESLLQFVDVVANACNPERQLITHDLPSRREARDKLRLLPAMAGVSRAFYDRPIVCVHTGAGSVNKQWPAGHFAGLIDLLLTEQNVSILLIGGPDERDFVESVRCQAKRSRKIVSIVGKTSLRELPSVLLACDLYVGNDSGPKHMAAGLGVPTIGIHSGSVDAGEWGPIGPHTITIRRDMTCAPCYIARASDCPRALACLTGISVADVFGSCLRLLALRKDNAERQGLPIAPPGLDKPAAARLPAASPGLREAGALIE
jgi:ADP-heptose:LPS heptosyltransferase/GT2 family glycosyltransferase